MAEPDVAARALVRALGLNADLCEETVRVALEARDLKGVEAALVLLTACDPHRAEQVWETMRAGLDIAKEATDA